MHICKKRKYKEHCILNHQENANVLQRLRKVVYGLKEMARAWNSNEINFLNKNVITVNQGQHKFLYKTL